MGFFDEMKSDGMKSLGMLGAVLGFVVLFLMWSVGTWLLILVLLLLAGGYIVYKQYR